MSQLRQPPATQARGRRVGENLPTSSSASPRPRRSARRRNCDLVMPEIVGSSRQAQDLRKTITRLAPEDCSVLILGESGTGKELVAQALHRLSERRDRPFLAVNCAAIPESTAESELFGHERGAFTGASQLRRGYFEQADGGVLFLDEVADLSPAMQVRLLRVLQEREVVRMSSNSASRPIQVDLRVVAATNKNIEAERIAERFREDLYWRLTTCVVSIPPLRKRGRDAVELFRHFLDKRETKRAERGKDPRCQRIGRDAQEVLMRHPWSGNVRELQRVVERVCIVTPGRRIGAAHLRAVGCEPGDARDERPQGEVILELVDKSGSASNAEVCTETGLTRSKVGKALATLVQRGKLVRTGGGRGSRYVRTDRLSDSRPALTDRQSRILEHTRMVERITRREAAKLTGASPRTAIRDLNRLVELKNLVPDGRKGKAAGYVLV